MVSGLRGLARLHPGALLVLLILFSSLLLAGANNAASAALLSAALFGASLIAVTRASRSALAQTLAYNALPLAGALLFAGWAALQLLPADTLMQQPHPAHMRPDAPLSLSPYRTMEGLAAFGAPCAAFFLGALAGGERGARDAVARWTILLAGLYALIGLGLFFQGASGPRLDVGIGSANVAAVLFGLLALCCAGLIVRAARGKLQTLGGEHTPSLLRAPFALGVFILLFCALLLTASRAGLIATLAALAVFAILTAAPSLQSKGSRFSAVAAPFLLLGLFAGVLFLRGGDAVMGRFALTHEDWAVRQEIAATHWAFFLERPLTGHGLNTFHDLNIQAIAPDNRSALARVGSAHNIFVQALEETGLIGLACLTLLLAPLLIRALARLLRRGPSGEWSAAALAASILLFGHGLVDFALQTPALAALYAFLLGAWVGRPAT